MRLFQKFHQAALSRWRLVIEGLEHELRRQGCDRVVGLLKFGLRRVLWDLRPKPCVILARVHRPVAKREILNRNIDQLHVWRIAKRGDQAKRAKYLTEGR